MDSIIIDLNDNRNYNLYYNIVHEITKQKEKIEYGKAYIQVFEDGETCVNLEWSVRGKRVYLLTSPTTPLKIMQLMMAIDAAKRSSALEIIPIMPYMPYARQDKRDQYRGPIGAKVLATMLESAGATSFITVDLHADQIEGFFTKPIIHIKGKYLFADYLDWASDSNTVFCSPDAGGVKRVKKMRDLIAEKSSDGFTIPYVTIDKTRSGPNQIEDMTILGNVDGKDVIIIDDLCDTGGTLIKATDALLEAGALSVRVLVTHGVLSGNAEANLGDSKIKEFIMADTMYYDDGNGDYNIKGKLTMISIAKELANTIIGINTNGSVKNAR
jgi:ribose-phosphate pyrophosphokinase